MREIFFSHPLLRMGPYERTIARATVAALRITWLVIGLSLFWLVGADIRFVGGILLLVWIHNTAARQKPRHSLVFTPKSGPPLNADEILYAGTRNLLIAASAEDKLGTPNFDVVLLRELCREDFFPGLLARLEVNAKEFFSDVRSFPLPDPDAPVSLNPWFDRVLEFCRSLSLSGIPPEVLLLGLRKSPILDPLWVKYKISEPALFAAITMTLFRSRVRGGERVQAVSVYRPNLARGRLINRSWTSLPTPTLAKFGQDLTNLAAAGEIGYLVGHAAELDLTVAALSRDTKTNVLLIGDPGAGKETIVWHVAALINEDRAGAHLFDRRIVRLNLADILGRPAGEGEKILNEIVAEVISSRDVVLYVPEIELLVSRPGAPGLSILVPIIESGSIPLIASTDLVSFQRFLAGNSAFADNFETVKVKEVSEEDAAKILTLEAMALERRARVFVSARAVERCVFLARRFLLPRLLPGSAVDLLSEVVSVAQQKSIARITDEQIDEQVSRKVGIPVRSVTSEETGTLLRLEELIHRRLINQDEAVKEVSEAIRVYRAGLGRKKGTIGAFLFAGPTGVGKTELAKALAAVYFGGEENMSRFDMSKYQTNEAVQSFIGSPDGTILGQFTESVRMKPFSLILLDEFEKAHQDILDLFLPVFDEGTVADALGRRADFHNTIIICTSNAHSTFIKESLEKGISVKEISVQLKTKLTDYFKPELLNRFDAVIAFKPLGPEEVKKIAALLMKEVQNTMRDKGVALSIADEALARIAALGYDAVYGARALSRVISEKVRDPLAVKLLRKEIGTGDAVEVGVSGGELAFRVVKTLNALPT